MQHISGSDINIMVGTTLVNVKSYTLNIEDGVSATTTRGIVDGWVNGEVGASGEFTVNTANLNLIMDVAREAGSFQQIPPTDLIGSGKTVDQELKVAAYGCKMSIAKVLESGDSSGGALEHTIPYTVTDKRFVEINGVPYLDQNRIAELGD
ncbi:phage protein [Marinomonas fungiae]|uniref:phage protein n=1 Tax=Marinomonas fungiae TaxID=1137284 RepID=UPI003A8DE5BF